MIREACRIFHNAPFRVIGTKPSPLLPELAPLSASYPGLIVSVWFGLLAPVKTIFADAELQRRLTPLGLDPEWRSGADLSRKIENDTAGWRDFIKAANIKEE